MSFFFLCSIFIFCLLLTTWAAYLHSIILLIILDCLLLVNVLFFVLVATITGNITGYVWAIFILIIAACDTVVGLGIFVVYFRLSGKIQIKNLSAPFRG